MVDSHNRPWFRCVKANNTAGNTIGNGNGSCDDADNCDERSSAGASMAAAEKRDRENERKMESDSMAAAERDGEPDGFGPARSCSAGDGKRPPPPTTSTVGGPLEGSGQSSEPDIYRTTRCPHPWA